MSAPSAARARPGSRNPAPPASSPTPPRGARAAPDARDRTYRAPNMASCPAGSSYTTECQRAREASSAKTDAAFQSRRAASVRSPASGPSRDVGKGTVPTAPAATPEVSESQIEAVYNAWEMERHHSAERNLYPEVLDVLARIKEDHPGVVFGAVTDGRANPLLMPFTLAQWFDFCVSWEDDQGGRTKFFTELHDATDDEQLMWIYEAALDKYREISALRGSLRRDDGTEECDVSDPGCHDVWIHVGDDVAYDCGGAGRCGARTVLAELAQKYGQTERLRGAGGGEGGGGRRAHAA